jgi:hypothetical protein
MWFKQAQPPSEYVAGMPDGFGVVLLSVASGLEVFGQSFPTDNVSACLLVLACLMVVVIQ